MTTDTTAQTIDAEVNEQTISFDVSVNDYNRFVNSYTDRNKVQPSINLCMQTVQQEYKSALKKLMQAPGMGASVAQAVIEEYQPEITVTAKKRTAEDAE